MLNGMLEILYFCIACLLVLGVAGLMVGALYAWEECSRFATFRIYELFEQHWSGY